MQILKATIDDCATIRRIASTTWADTYREILSPEQSEYMLDMMYSDHSLAQQMENGHHFVLAIDEQSGEYRGLVSYEFGYHGENKVKIHKLYVLPESHGSGLGKLLVDYVAEQALAHGCNTITLNMNRFNHSHGFYTHMGFVIAGEEDIDIGNGYLMEDYIFEKTIG